MYARNNALQYRIVHRTIAPWGGGYIIESRLVLMFYVDRRVNVIPTTHRRTHYARNICANFAGAHGLVFGY